VRHRLPYSGQVRKWNKRSVASPSLSSHEDSSFTRVEKHKSGCTEQNECWGTLGVRRLTFALTLRLLCPPEARDSFLSVLSAHITVLVS
jgi:hypothetical protein